MPVPRAGGYRNTITHVTTNNRIQGVDATKLKLFGVYAGIIFSLLGNRSWPQRLPALCLGLVLLSSWCLHLSCCCPLAALANPVSSFCPPGAVLAVRLLSSGRAGQPCVLLSFFCPPSACNCPAVVLWPRWPTLCPSGHLLKAKVIL